MERRDHGAERHCATSPADRRDHVQDEGMWRRGWRRARPRMGPTSMAIPASRSLHLTSSRLSGSSAAGAAGEPAAFDGESSALCCRIMWSQWRLRLTPVLSLKSTHVDGIVRNARAIASKHSPDFFADPVKTSRRRTSWNEGRYKLRCQFVPPTGLFHLVTVRFDCSLQWLLGGCEARTVAASAEGRACMTHCLRLVIVGEGR